MKISTACLISGVVMMLGCKEKPEVTVTESRAPSDRDSSPKLFATSDQRFRDAKPSPVKGDAPAGWLALPATPMRLVNYRFGESGTSEVYVSISQGTVLDNVNRWLKQFSADPVDDAGLGKLPTISLAGSPGIWVTADGEYASGMGAEPKPGYGLAGVIASVGGQILTVKMVGPKAEVEAAKPALEAYAKSLRMAE